MQAHFRPRARARRIYVHVSHECLRGNGARARLVQAHAWTARRYVSGARFLLLSTTTAKHKEELVGWWCTHERMHAGF